MKTFKLLMLALVFFFSLQIHSIETEKSIVKQVSQTVVSLTKRYVLHRLVHIAITAIIVKSTMHLIPYCDERQLSVLVSIAGTMLALQFSLCYILEHFLSKAINDDNVQNFIFWHVINDLYGLIPDIDSFYMQMFEKNKTKIANYVIQKSDFLINKLDVNGRPALYYAVANANYELVRNLIEKYNSLNLNFWVDFVSFNRPEFSLLQMAINEEVIEKSPEIASLLISSGVDLEARYYGNANFFDYMKNNPRLQKILKKYKEDLTTKICEHIQPNNGANPYNVANIVTDYCLREGNPYLKTS